MTNKPTTQPANPPAGQPDNVTQVAAINGDYLITANLPAMPLTPEERKMEFRTLLDELLATAVGKELFVLAMEARRTYIKKIGDIDEAQFWNYFFAGVLQNRERTNALGTALEEVRGYLREGALDDIRNWMESSDGGGAKSAELTAFGQDLQRTDGDDKVWRFLNPFPDNQSKLLFATLIGERVFTKATPNEITTGHNITVDDFDDVRHRLYYENGDSPVNFQFAGRRSQLDGVALKISSDVFAPYPQALTIMFDYILGTRQLNENETISLLRFGNRKAAIGLNAEVGAFVSKAEFIPNQTTTTYVSKLLLPTNAAAPTHRIAVSAAEAAAGGVAFDQFYFYVRPGLPQNAIIQIHLTAFPGTSGAQTTASAEYEVADWDTDQELFSDLYIPFVVGDDGVQPPPLIITGRYIADHNGGHAIHVSTAAVTTVTPYEISAGYFLKKTVNRPSEGQYAKIPIRAAADHFNGLFNAQRDPELQLNTGITVMAQFIVGSDGYIHVRVLVNGVAENDGNFINTQRTAGNMGLSSFSRNRIAIGDALTRISRVYGIASGKALTVAQMQKINQHRATPGLNYYGLRAPAPEYNLAARLRVQDDTGASFAVAPPGIRPILGDNGNPKNFLTSPITGTSSNNQQNQRTIPEMATAKAIVVVVGEVDIDENGDAILTDDSSRMIFDPRPFHQSHSITGRIGRHAEIHYYFSFPQRHTIRLDYRTSSGGQSNGIHQIFLLR